MLLHSGRRLGLVVGVLATAGVLLAACGSDDGSDTRSGSASGSGAGSGSGSVSGSGSGAASGTGEECVLVGNSDEDPTGTVEVALKEFTIDPVPDEIEAGTIEFKATNDGAEPHELVVVKFDGDPADVPTAEDGSADEEQLPEGAVIGEIEGFAADHSCTAAFDLEPGKYVLLCNIVEEEDGETEAHYDMGMSVAFTVT